IDHAVEMRGIVREARELQVDEAEGDLRRRHRVPERERPALRDRFHAGAGTAVGLTPVGDRRGGVLQQHLGGHRTPPCAPIAQSRMAMASASLSSAGANPRARTAAITAALSAFPLPVTWRLMAPTGTP